MTVPSRLAVAEAAGPDSILARATSLPWWSAAAIVVLAILSWPSAAGAARTGLDPSWEAALHLAFQTGTNFGSGIVFTYGPLGFLAWAWPWYGAENALSFAFIAATHLLICAVVFIAARRVLPGWQALVYAYIAMRAVTVLEPYEALFLGVIAIAFSTLLGRAVGRQAWIVVGLGIISGIALLGKLNVGLFVAAISIVVIVAAARPRWPVLAGFVATAAITFLGLWFATGQRLTDLIAYATGSFEIIRGYSEAMGVDRTQTDDWVMLAYFVTILLVARMALGGVRERPRAQQIGVLAVALLAGFAFFKTGFVRGGYGYALSAVLIAFFVMAEARTPRPLFMAVFAATFLSLVAAVGRSPVDLVNPVPAVRAFVREAAVVLRPWTWPTAEQRTRDQLQAQYRLEPAILSALAGGATVHVDPWETAVMAAYPALRWRPEPVFQSYSAYTSQLDELNAAALRADDAPQRILREGEVSLTDTSRSVPVTIDGRYRWFDAPAAMLETFCRYDEIAASQRWEVLGPAPRRCGAPEPLATVTAKPGEVVTVPRDPRPDRIVVVRVHGIDDSLLDRALTTIYKASEWYVTLGGIGKYRLVPGTAQDGLLMAVPASIHRSPGFDFGPPIPSISIAQRDRFPAPGPLTYEFLSVPLVQP
jgi:hypothetical protein